MATADGARGNALGISSTIEAHPEIVDSRLALTKGGLSIRDLFGGERTLHAIANSEKGFAVLGLTATTETANQKLAAAISKIYAWRPEARLTSPVLELLDHLADDTWFPKNLVMRSPSLSSIFLVDGLASDPHTAPLVRNTVSVTRLQSGPTGGRAESERAHATLVAHLLPGVTPVQFKNRIRAVVDDPNLHIVIEAGFEFSTSKLDQTLFSIIARHVRTSPSQLVTPFMATETSDARHLRRIGVPTYGFVPLTVSKEALLSINGQNEKVQLEEYQKGMERMFYIVRDLSNSKRSASKKDISHPRDFEC